MEEKLNMKKTPLLGILVLLMVFTLACNTSTMVPFAEMFADKPALNPQDGADAFCGYRVHVFAENINPDAWTGWEIDTTEAIADPLGDDCTLHLMAGTNSQQYVGSCSPCTYGSDVFIPYNGAEYISYMAFAPESHADYAMEGSPFLVEDYCKETASYIFVEMKTLVHPTTVPASK
jgi:hypothetical protein